MNKKIIFISSFITLSTLSSSLLCMYDGERYPLVFNNNTGVLQRMKIGSASHKDLCALGTINQDWDHILQRSADQKREYLENNIEALKPIKENNNLMWHKYGGACIYLEKEINQLNFSSYQKYDKLHFYYLDENNKIGSTTILMPFVKPSIITSPPFFNNKGNACLLRDESIPHRGDNTTTIFEYSCDTDNTYKKRECFFTLEEKINEYPERHPLTILMHCPVLLEAFSRSSQVKEDDIKKICDVKGINLHKNYILHGKFPNEKIRQAVARCLLETKSLRAKY